MQDFNYRAGCACAIRMVRTACSLSFLPPADKKCLQVPLATDTGSPNRRIRPLLVREPKSSSRVAVQLPLFRGLAMACEDNSAHVVTNADELVRECARFGLARD